MRRQRGVHIVLAVILLLLMTFTWAWISPVFERPPESIDPVVQELNRVAAHVAASGERDCAGEGRGLEPDIRSRWTMHRGIKSVELDGRRIVILQLDRSTCADRGRFSLTVYAAGDFELDYKMNNTHYGGTALWGPFADDAGTFEPT